MVRELASLLLTALLTSACGAVSAPSAQPSFPPPSNACGGFHLLVANNDDYKVDVVINEGRMVSVQAYSELMVVPFFEPELPEFPWVVDLTRSVDGLWVGTANLDEGVTDTKITVSNGQINVANLDVAATGC